VVVDVAKLSAGREAYYTREIAQNHEEYLSGHGESPALLGWAQRLGEVDAWGIEGTGSFGAGLTRFLRGHGQVVVEVNRPDRQARRRRGKSDPIDAEAAARAVQAQQGSIPKAGDGQVEMIRSLRVARATASKARSQAVNALKALLVTAPAELREQLRGCRRCGWCRPPPRWSRARSPPRWPPPRWGCGPSPPLPGPVGRARRLGRRAGPADRRGRAPAAGAVWGRGGLGRGAAGSRRRQPERLRSDAAFAMLCGASPIEASSGKTRRYRLNRGGDRQANAALYRIVVARLRHDPRTQEYLARRIREGKSKKEAIRWLKRCVAREVFAVLPR
jgi:transposase